VKVTRPSKRRVKDNISRGVWVQRWLIVNYGLFEWMKLNFVFTFHDMYSDRFMSVLKWGPR
jgi:hypothetical protein